MPDRPVIIIVDDERAYQQAWLFGAKFIFAREVNRASFARSKKDPDVVGRP